MIRKKLKPISILFVGNSFSYYHNLPRLIVNFARVSGAVDLAVDGVFKGGASLKMLQHGGRALKKLRSKAQDYVALQERGRLGGTIRHGIVRVGKPLTFFASATRFHNEIRKIGAKTILYCPPAFLGSGRYAEAKKLDAAYSTLLFYKKLFHKRTPVLITKSYLSKSAELPKNPKGAKLLKADARFLWSVAAHIR